MTDREGLRKFREMQEEGRMVRARLKAKWLRDSELNARLEAGFARREAKRAAKELIGQATLRWCRRNPGCPGNCWIPEHLSADYGYPVRIVTSQKGVKYVHTVEEVLPNEARRLQRIFGMEVMVGSLYHIKMDGRRGNGRAKWDWSITYNLETSMVS